MQKYLCAFVDDRFPAQNPFDWKEVEAENRHVAVHDFVVTASKKYWDYADGEKFLVGVIDCGYRMSFLVTASMTFDIDLLAHSNI